MRMTGLPAVGSQLSQITSTSTFFCRHSPAPVPLPCTLTAGSLTLPVTVPRMRTKLEVVPMVAEAPETEMPLPSRELNTSHSTSVSHLPRLAKATPMVTPPPLQR